MALADLKKAELVALCLENELDKDGTKAELIARLEEAGVGAEPAPQDDVVKTAVEVTELESPTDVDMSDFDMDAGTSEEFLKALYLKVLGREVDSGGLAHYTRVLEFYKTQTRADILNDLLGSDEYKLKQG